MGDKFGQSIVNGNAILDDVNPQMPTIRHDIQQLATLGDAYADAAPDLFDFLNNAATTAHTIHAQEKDWTRRCWPRSASATPAPTSSSGAGRIWFAAPADLVPTAQLLDTYSPELFCTIRNLHDVEPKVAAFAGGNGYSLRSRDRDASPGRDCRWLPGLGITAATGGLAALAGLVSGAPNPYVYPDNLPRINAHGGPGGAPGCWQPITRDLWPAPIW